MTALRSSRVRRLVPSRPEGALAVGTLAGCSRSNFSSCSLTSCLAQLVVSLQEATSPSPSGGGGCSRREEPASGNQHTKCATPQCCARKQACSTSTCGPYVRTA